MTLWASDISKQLVEYLMEKSNADRVRLAHEFIDMVAGMIDNKDAEVARALSAAAQTIRGDYDSRDHSLAQMKWAISRYLHDSASSFQMLNQDYRKVENRKPMSPEEQQRLFGNFMLLRKPLEKVSSAEFRRTYLGEKVPEPDIPADNPVALQGVPIETDA